MPPRILGFAVKSHFPFCLVEVTQTVAGWHRKAVVQQSHDALGRVAFAVEANPADQCLVAERDKVGVFADWLVVINGDELAVLVELDVPSDDAGWRDFVDVFLGLGTRVRQSYRSRAVGYRRKICFD